MHYYNNQLLETEETYSYVQRFIKIKIKNKIKKPKPKNKTISEIYCGLNGH